LFFVVALGVTLATADAINRIQIVEVREQLTVYGCACFVLRRKCAPLATSLPPTLPLVA
jgi:hypothetical protein